MDESISVSSIIDKLPPSWKDFKHTLKHGKDDMSLVELGSHLRIEESLRAQDSDEGKGKEVGRPSVNMTEEGGIAKVVKRTTQMLVVRERGLRTNPKTKVDAIVWWIDYGATTLICKDRCWFKTYEPVEDGYVFYMGDDHFAHDHGKGSVALEFSSRKTITLYNVLYVPKLRHVHYTRMLEKSKDDLIPDINENLEKKYYLVPIKRKNTTPYELWYKKRPNLAFLRVWGYRAVVRLSDPKRKTLGEKIPEPCKGKRVQKAKSYGSDFQLYLVERSRDQVGLQYSYCYSIEEDSRTYNEAMQS
uniref:Putative zinc finger, CCHC-type n=1 Tax=Tanacetum cinerariifolium TaxID=118510 RepID=A0A699INX9_TANCI|nr:putative zinc finger, CCHC-type [Tanacetum cinerariifolium]